MMPHHTVPHAVGSSVRLPLLLLFASCVAFGCRPGAESAAPEAVLPIRVHVVTARHGEISDVRRVTGQTTALRIVRLASPVAGRVTFLAPQPGDSLADGAVAARVMPTENEAALNGMGVLGRGAALQPHERDAAQRLGHGLRAGDIPIHASFAGLVSARLHNPGELVAQNDVLLELFDPQSLYVVAQIPIEMLPDVRNGVPVEVVAGGARIRGHIDALVPAVDPQALSVPARVTLEQPLLPPMLSAAVECRLQVARHSDAKLLPRAALISSQIGDQGTDRKSVV